MWDIELHFVRWALDTLRLKVFDATLDIGRYAVFHQPHPGKEIYPSDLKRIRRFLVEAGVIG